MERLDAKATTAAAAARAAAAVEAAARAAEARGAAEGRVRTCEREALESFVVGLLRDNRVTPEEMLLALR